MSSDTQSTAICGLSTRNIWTEHSYDMDFLWSVRSIYELFVEIAGLYNQYMTFGGEMGSEIENTFHAFKSQNRFFFFPPGYVINREGLLTGGVG